MSEDSQFSEEEGWIQWFCGLEDHFFFCEVDEDYIRDNFNLYGTTIRYNHLITYYSHSNNPYLTIFRTQTEFQQLQRGPGNDPEP